MQPGMNCRPGAWTTEETLNVYMNEQLFPVPLTYQGVFRIILIDNTIACLLILCQLIYDN